MRSSAEHAHQVDALRRRKSVEGTSWTVSRGSGRATEQVPVSAYVGSSNLQDVKAPHTPCRLRGGAERTPSPGSTEKPGGGERIARGGGRGVGAYRSMQHACSRHAAWDPHSQGAHRSRGGAGHPSGTSVDSIFLRDRASRAGAAVTMQSLEI